MTLPSRVTGAFVATVSATALGITGVAAATPGDSAFQQTYPRAAQLCTQVAQGSGPKALRRSATQVLADCAALENGFNTARTAVVTAQASLASQRTLDRTASTNACTGPAVVGATCDSARRAAHHAVAALEIQRVQLQRSYQQTIETDRRTFWTTIGALPGGASLVG